MNLGDLHAYLGRLMDAGLAATLPVTVVIDDNLPCELVEAAILSGPFKRDPAPKLTPYRNADGPMLALVSVCQDPSVLTGTHKYEQPPVDKPRTRNEHED